MRIQILLILFLSVVYLTKCEHLILGDTNRTSLLFHTVAHYHAIPFTKRVKNVFYNSPEQKVINVSNLNELCGYPCRDCRAWASSLDRHSNKIRKLSIRQISLTSILVYDNLHSLATATVTAGGISHTYVNIRLKSERGVGLDYDIGIYS